MVLPARVASCDGCPPDRQTIEVDLHLLLGLVLGNPFGVIDGPDVGVVISALGGLVALEDVVVRLAIILDALDVVS